MYIVSEKLNDILLQKLILTSLPICKDKDKFADFLPCLAAMHTNKTLAKITKLSPMADNAIVPGGTKGLVSLWEAQI